MRVKDIIALGLLALVSFPVILLGVLMWTGNVRLAFGPEDPSQTASRERLQVRPEDLEHASTPIPQSENHMDGALGMRETELDRREADLQREMVRVTQLRDQDQILRDAIEADRKRIEELVSGKDTLRQARMLMLAKTFTGMKPDQAAKILVDLDDVMVTGILRAISEDRPRAKVLASIGKLDTQRAAAIARLLRSSEATPPAARPESSAKPDTTAPKKEAKP